MPLALAHFDVFDCYNRLQSINIFYCFSFFLPLTHTQLCRTYRAAGQFEGALPYGGYDGAGLCYDWRDHTIFQWLRDGTCAQPENCAGLQVVLGAIVIAIALRLW